jgi:hypothetical protein
MDHHWDEFSKLLAESVPRRESLRRLGIVFAGAALSPLGLGTAWARGPDPCVAFCRCRNNNQQSQCLAVCRACKNNTSRIGGTCGSYVCCSKASCGGHCADLFSDPNCGACGHDCRAVGLTCCGGDCADLDSDDDNCGACGHVCTAPTPYCVEGTCTGDVCPPGQTKCGTTCTNLSSDPANCGACGNSCAGSTPFCNVGTCGAVQCFGGQALCSGVCREIQLDPQNCGGCGVVCGPGENCAGGLCQSAEPQ